MSMRLILFLFFLCPLAGKSQWTTLHTAPGTVNHLVHFENADTGIVMGQRDGRCQFLRTTDGGATWTSELPDTGGVQLHPFVRKHFITDSIGFVADIGGLWFTRDAGRNFEFRGSPLALVSGVHFLDSLEGFCTGTHNAMAHTTDGGYSWALSMVTSSPTKTWRDVWAWDADHLMVGGTFGSLTLFGGSLTASTTDGGAAWNAFVLDSEFFQGLDLEFVSDSTGFFADEGHLWKTTDRGLSWLPVWTQTDFNKVNKSSFIDALTGFAWGPPNGYLIKTTDGGSNWQPQAEGNVWTVNDLHCPTPQVCYAVGAEGLVMKTTTGGGSLSVNPSATKAMFSMYPNPAVDRIYLSGQEEEGIFTIADARGMLVARIVCLRGEQIEVKVSDWPAGMYAVSFVSETQSLTCRRLLKP